MIQSISGSEAFGSDSFQGSESKRLPELLNIRSADRQFRTLRITQANIQPSTEPSADILHEVQVHDCRTVDPKKGCRIESFLEITQ